MMVPPRHIMDHAGLILAYKGSSCVFMDLHGLVHPCFLTPIASCSDHFLGCMASHNVI